jgi:hypothetical protein
LPSFGLFICLLIFVASAVASMIFIFSRRKFSKLYAVKGLVYLCACVCIIGVFRLNTFVGKRNAHRIIKAVEMCKSDKGSYPAELSDLVPVYISSIPVSAYRLSYSEYHYSSKQGSHYLMWVTMPPYGRRMYHFEVKEWTYLD